MLLAHHSHPRGIQLDMGFDMAETQSKYWRMRMSVLGRGDLTMEAMFGILTGQQWPQIASVKSPQLCNMRAMLMPGRFLHI